MSSLKSNGDSVRQALPSVVVPCSDEKANCPVPSSADPSVCASDVSKPVRQRKIKTHPLKSVDQSNDQALFAGLKSLIAKLAAKRWYRMQAEQQEASRGIQSSAEHSCPKDTAAPDADASQQPKTPSVKKPRKKK